MDMIDMKLPKKSKAELKKDCGMVGPSTDQEQWPYGLQIRFEKEQIDKIPSLATHKVGDRIRVEAEAVVTAIRISERQSGKEDHSLELQIEKVACEPAMKKSLDKMSMKEYRAARGK